MQGQQTYRRSLATGEIARRIGATSALLGALTLLSVLLAGSGRAQAPVASLPAQTNTPTPLSSPTYPTTCQIIINDSIIGSVPMQTGILNSLQVPSVCQFYPRTCPGVADNLPRGYKIYRYYNPFSSFSNQCINIRIDATGCPGNLFSAAYNFFSPGDLCSTYLGDSGGPIMSSGSYEFSIFRARYLDIVVSEVTPGSGCSGFTITVTAQHTCLTWPPATPTPTSTRTPTRTPTTYVSPTSTLISPTVTATAVASQTSPSSSTATSISLPPTSTATPTHCPISFNDVEPGSTFYPFVRCLACRGIVNGYADGTYRPGDPVTRGQASKIIANAAGWQDEIPPSRQTFNDVPPGSTFWLYVERMHAHQAIEGYPCGEPGEPCPGAYFRPGATLTRGQVAKITTISAGFDDTIPPKQQTFADVPPGSTFWLYIERAALHGVVNGYTDGTYRPNNTVTRGQIAKIAANAFFAACFTPNE